MADYICRICGNKRFIYKLNKRTKEEYSVPCPYCKDIISQKQIYTKMKKAEIPDIYYDYEFSIIPLPEQETIVPVLKQYIEQFKLMSTQGFASSLYLGGPRTTSKTTCSCIIGKELLKQDVNVKFILAGDLINLLLKGSGYEKDKDIHSMIADYKYAEFLIIDDIFDVCKGIFWNNDTSRALILTEWDLFLRYRLSHGLRIVVTSNFSMKDIHIKFGENLQKLFNRNFKEFKFSTNIEHLIINNIEKNFKYNKKEKIKED